jgi:hypothetical protein
MHTKIDSEIWVDEDFDGLEAGEKLAALWLMTRCDMLGWVPISGERVFTFQTRVALGCVEGACEKMPRTFKRMERGVLVLTYVRRQFGCAESLRRSSLYPTLRKKLKLVPEAVAAAVLEMYPELKSISEGAPTVPVGTKEKEKEKHKEKEKDQGGVGGGEGRRGEGRGGDGETAPLDVRLLEQIRDAYAPVRRDSPTQVLEILRDKVQCGVDPQEMLAGTRECARRYALKFPPGGPRCRFANSAVQFFSRDLWNDPDAFADKFEASEGRGEKKEGGAVSPEVYGTAPKGMAEAGEVEGPEGWQGKGEEIFEHRWERWADVPEVNRREIVAALRS